MNRDIAQLNITHFRELLAKETDEEKRGTLARLLAEEEAKLKSLDEARAKSRG